MVSFANLSDLEIKKLVAQRMRRDDYKWEEDRYFDDIGKIGALLSSEELCLRHAKLLNDALVNYAKTRQVFDQMTEKSFWGARKEKLVTPKGGTIKASIGPEGAEQFNLTVAQHKHHKVLSGFLAEFEAEQGFNEGAYSFETKNKIGADVTLNATPGKAVTLPGFAPAHVFRQQLLAKARHFKDPGVGALHGEFTHRIQWYIVCKAAAELALQNPCADIFKACARPEFFNNPVNVSVWDLIFEGGGTAQDFRKPEMVTEFFLRVSQESHPRHGDLWFLAALMEGRYAKRLIEKRNG